MNENEEIKTLKILLDGVRGKLDFQLNSDNSLDTKSGVLIALLGTVTIFYINILNNPYYCFNFIPLIFIGISAFYILEAIKTQKYNTGLIDVYDENKKYRDMKEYDLLNQLLSDYQKAFDDNSKILKNKNKNYKKGLNFFLISILLIIILSII